MSAQASLISDLEAAITSSGSDRRMEALRRVTDLFLANADRYEPEQIEVFDDVLGRMISHIEGRALVELSRRLAAVDSAPPRLIRTLAMDDAIEVAGPVIEASSRLSTGDLVNIATTKSQDHLLAICGRKEVDEAVTDVLVERGNAAVARKVAVNQGARFSGNGYVSLVKWAEHDDQLIDIIGRRSDLTPQLFQELLRRATEAVRDRLLAMRPDLEDGVSDVVQRASEELAKASVTHDYSLAKRLVQPLHHDGKLKEKVILGFARDKRFEEVVVALSLLCASQIDLIDRLLQGVHIDAALIPCKAAGLGWPTVKAVIQLNPFHRALADARYQRLHQDYKQLSVATAQRIIRFWQVRHKTDGAEPA